MKRHNYALQTSIIYYNFNKLGHIARFYKGKNVRSYAPQKKIDTNQQKKVMNKVWKKKEESKVKNESIP